MSISHRGCVVATFVIGLATSGCSRFEPQLSIAAPSPQATQEKLAAEAAASPVSASVKATDQSIAMLDSTTSSKATTSITPHDPTDIDPAKITAKGHPKQWWEAVYADGTKIGWEHTEITDFEQSGRKLVEVNNQDHVSVDRSGQLTTIDIATRSLETPQGEPLSFHTELISGASRTAMTGHVDEGQLTIDTVTPGKTITQSFPLPADTLGFSATEQSLANSPLLSAGRRTLHALMPATNEVVTIDLSAAEKYQPTPLLDHTEDLLQIDSTITLPMHSTGDKPPVIRSQLWINREGEVLKTSMAALHQETYRAAREIALAPTGPRRLDLVFDNTVPVARSLDNPHDTKRVRYRVQLTGDDPAKVFAASPLQTIVPLDSHTAEITVRRIDFLGDATSRSANQYPALPDGGALNHDALLTGSVPTSFHLPTEDDRKPNNLIQSDDDQVVALAKSVAPNEADPWKLALALERYVNQIVKLKNFSQTFDTAADVARNREGDCTEHAVLLAALARARGIPARVAIGLIYQAGTQSFVYHMWNELWISNRWVPLDATLGRGGIGAAHLKLTDSNLAGAQAYSCFLPVAQVIGQLKIEILEVE